jgi:hypothetical protein
VSQVFPANSNVKHPEIAVRLVGTDGNAYAVLGAVRRALRDAGVSDEEIQAFSDDATAADYNHLLATCMAWVDIT